MLNRCLALGPIWAALALGQALPCLCAAATDGEAARAWGEIVKTNKQVFEAIKSYEYELKSYSKHSPESFYRIRYKELGDSYYFDTEIVSSDPKRQHPGSIETWNGERALRLRRETRILYIHNKPYDFTNEWRHVNGLWSPFAFIKSKTTLDRIKSPQLDELIDFFKSPSLQVRVQPKIDIIEQKKHITLETNGGVNLMDGVPETIVTSFDLSESLSPLPKRWTLIDPNGKVRAKLVILDIQHAELGAAKEMRIIYPAKVEATYFDAKGAISNVVIDEYSHVRFNQADLTTFDIDPSEAEKIIDEANGGKLIMVPK
jgi:hypothetical protein